jgi:cell division protein FtsB
MRRNRAELSSISLSALDVFASALGVFIILTSVSLPFIFNTSQSTEKNLTKAELEAQVKSFSSQDQALKELINNIVDLKQEVEKLNDALALEADKGKSANRSTKNLTQKIAALEKTLIEAEEELEAAAMNEKSTELIPPIDIMIALDTTGSMTDQLRSLQGGVIYLSRILMKWSESPAVGIVEIMDQCDFHNRKKFTLQTINAASLRNFQTFVYSLGRAHTGCNNDQEEGIHLALRETIATTWRPNVEKRVIILISDFPPYPYALNEVKRSIRVFSSEQNQSVSIVHPVNSYSTSKHVEIMRQLAVIGNGEYIDGAGSIIGAIMLAL